MGNLLQTAVEIVKLHPFWFFFIVIGHLLIAVLLSQDKSVKKIVDLLVFLICLIIGVLCGFLCVWIMSLVKITFLSWLLGILAALAVDGLIWFVVLNTGEW